MRIDFFAGPSFEPFSPKSSAEGRGGSEEMIIILAKELAKRNKVYVWNRCQDDEGIYDGVEYRNYEDFDVKKTDVLIVWRSPELLLKFKLDKVQGKKYLWLHDTIPHLDLLPFTFSFDGILTLSKWHKEYYTALLKPEYQDRIVQTRNAVDYTDFEQTVKRDPYTMVYGSLYNRGLVELLTLWSKIKLAVPEAKLRVFYGWNTLEKLLPTKEFKEFKKQVDGLLDQEGITHLGRISHKEVAKEMLGAGIWVYPNTYNEVSCITAMKAQIAGAIPVVIPRAALDETVKYGVKVRHGQNMGEILDNWSDALIDLLKRPKDQEVLRELMIKKSKNLYTVKELVKSWEKMFKEANDK